MSALEFARFDFGCGWGVSQNLRCIPLRVGFGHPYEE